MDVHSYIDSGILEQYVSGLLTDEENAEVDRLASEFPEIQHEIDTLRSSLNNYAAQTGKAPDYSILEGALNNIDNPDHRDHSTQTEEAPTTPRKRWIAFAASFIILLSIAGNFFLFNEVLDFKQKYDNLQNQLSQLDEELEIVSSPVNMKVPLNGLSKAPESHAMVYINQQTKDVYIKIGKLPTPPEGHQYQLWADRDGHMHNIGVFHHNEKVQHLTVFEGGFESLNVTLEKEGGSEVATVENAYLTGRL
jgi:hypothetical protein